MVGTVADGFSTVDPSLQTEVRDLVPTGERPADILTTAALPGAKAACDLTIVSPDAVHAGLDACATAHADKNRKYAPHFRSMQRIGVVFRLMV